MNGYRVAIVGPAEVDDPDGLRTAGVEGGAMGVRIACRQLADQVNLGFRYWAHGHHHRSVEAAGGAAGEAGDKHRHQRAALHVSHANSRLDQRMLESQAAAQQKGDKVVAPQVANLRPLLDQFAPAVDTVAVRKSAPGAERTGSG